MKLKKKIPVPAAVQAVIAKKSRFQAVVADVQRKVHRAAGQGLLLPLLF